MEKGRSKTGAEVAAPVAETSGGERAAERRRAQELVRRKIDKLATKIVDIRAASDGRMAKKITVDVDNFADMREEWRIKSDKNYVRRRKTEIKAEEKVIKDKARVGAEKAFVEESEGMYDARGGKAKEKAQGDKAADRVQAEIDAGMREARFTEYHFARWLRVAELSMMKMSGMIASEYDDFANGVDLIGVVRRTQVKGGEVAAPVVFALDVTRGKSAVGAKRKFEKKTSGYVGAVEKKLGATHIGYPMTDMDGNLEQHGAMENVPRFVIGVDERKLKELEALRLLSPENVVEEGVLQEEWGKLSEEIQLATVAQIAVQARALVKYYENNGGAGGKLMGDLVALDKMFSRALMVNFDREAVKVALGDDVGKAMLGAIGEQYGFKSDVLGEGVREFLDDMGERNREYQAGKEKRRGAQAIKAVGGK